MKQSLLHFIILLLSTLSTTAPLPACAQTQATNQVIKTRTVQGLEKQVTPGSWVLIDLDFTLFEASDSHCHAKWFYDRLKDQVAQGKTKEDAIRSFYPEWTAKQNHCPVKLIEDGMSAFVQSLQTKGIPVLGFTSRQKPIVDSTLAQIHSLGIDFSVTAPVRKSWESFTEKCPIVYKSGVLFACDYNKKGDVLEMFLASIKLAPSKIVFIDDGEENIESVRKAASSLRISYLGVHYTAYQDRVSQ